MLRFLRDHPEGVTTHDLIQHCTHKFAARLHELRGAGYAIESERLRSGSYRYRLIGSPSSGSAANGTPTASSPPAGPSGEVARLPDAPSVAAEPEPAGLFGPNDVIERPLNAVLADYEEEAA